MSPVHLRFEETTHQIYDQRKLEKLIAQSAEKWWSFKRGEPGNKMIYFKSRLRREDVMATLTRQDERVISRQSQGSSAAAESKAEKDHGEDLGSFTHG